MDIDVMGGVSLTCIYSMGRAASRENNRNVGTGGEGQIGGVRMIGLGCA